MCVIIDRTIIHLSGVSRIHGAFYNGVVLSVSRVAGELRDDRLRLSEESAEDTGARSRSEKDNYLFLSALLHLKH